MEKNKVNEAHLVSVVINENPENSAITIMHPRSNGTFRLVRVIRGKEAEALYDILFVQEAPERNVIQCAKDPEVVYNKILWLPDRDDDKARQILIEYEESQICKLQDKIQNHQAKINTLKEGAIYGR